MIELTDLPLWISFFMLSCALLLVLYKILFRFDSLSKLVALDVLSNTLVALIALWAFLNQQLIFIDITIAIALIMFLSTVANILFISSRDKNDSIS